MKKQKMSSLLSLLFIVFIAISFKSQTFIRTYNYPDMTGGLGLSKTSDGGFVGTGQHNGAPAGGCDIYIYRVTNCGSLLWYKTYGSAGSDGGRSVIQASDGGIILAGLWDDGSGSGNGYDFTVQKTDAAGNLQWITVWNGPANDGDYAHWITEGTGNIYASGSTYNSPWSNWNAVISAYTSGGSHQWTKAFGGGGEENFGSIHVIPGALLAGGHTTSFGSGGADLFIVKTDLFGNPIWMFTYGTSANEGRYWDTEGVPTPDGGYIIAGYTDNASLTAGGQDILLIKVGAGGNIKWAKTYGGTANDFAEGIAITPDGGAVIVGTTEGGYVGGRDACLLKVDSVGNLQWAKAYGDGGCDRGVSVVPIGSNYVLSMNYNNSLASCGINNEYDPMFVKTDSLGNIGGTGCTVANLSFVVNNVTSSIVRTTVPGSAFQSISVSVSNPIPGVSSLSPTESFKCISCTPTTPSFSMSANTICEGEPLTLINQTPSGSAACFEWLANSSPLGLFGDTVTTSSLPPGNYVIELKAICGNTVNSAQQTLIVNPKPDGDFLYSNNVCFDNLPVTYTSLVTSGSTGVSYQWYLGSGSVPSSATTPTVSNVNYAYPGVKNVALVITNVYGCKDSIVHQVSIEPLPSLNFSATNPTCVGDTTYFTNTTWIGGSGVIASWYWDFGDATSSTSSSPYHVYSSAGTYTVMLVATSDYGCDDTLYQTVNISPPTMGGSIVSNATVCAGSNSGTLTLTGNTGNVVYWQYSNDGGINWYALSNTSTLQPYANLNQTTIYQAYVQSGACPGMFSNTATITVDPVSVAGSLLKDTSVCANSNSGTLSLNSYTGSVVDWYASTDNGTTWAALGNNASNYIFNNLTATTWYQVIVKSGICPSDTSNIVHVNVSPATVGGTVTTSDTLCAASNNGTLTLIGNVGDVLYWQYSNDGGLSWIPLSNTSTTQPYANLTQTTLYQAYVKSGVCPGVLANAATITIDPISIAGIIKNDTLVCGPFVSNQFTLSNTGTLTLTNYTGSIVDWLVSTDNGTSWSSLSYTNPIYIFSNLTDTTFYTSIVKSGVCPPDTTPITKVIVRYFNGAAVSPSDTSISLGYSIQVTASGGVNYAWTPNYNISDTTTSSPVVWPFKDTSYIVHVRDNYGCYDTTTLKIYVIKDYKLIIANTMTPNGDGYNDFFWIGMIENYPNNEVMIFNRYGQIIYQGNNYDNKKVYWDGTYQGNKVPDGAYYYVIRFKDNNAVFKGSINVLSSH